MTCPKCSSPLEFQSLQTTQNICAQCFLLNENDSPLQIGSYGEFRTQSFRVIGCKKKATSHLAWLEWLVMLEDTSLAWIRESQGTWSLFWFDSPNEERRTFDLNTLDERFIYAGEKYILRRSAGASLEFQNGESLLQSVVGEISQVSEALRLKDLNSLLHIEVYAGSHLPFISRGEWVEFSSFNFGGLRSIDQSIQKIICPNCSSRFLVRHKSFSLRAVCNTCYSIIDISSDDHMSLSDFDRENKFDPAIAIGSQGKILGESFEVIGCMRLKNKLSPTFFIVKYLLYSSTQSYRWLREENGHWTISRVVNDLLKNSDSRIEYRGQIYSSDHSSQYQLLFAQGEFYWPLQKSEVFEADHFVAPPYELSFEKSAVYLGRYLSPRQVSSAFKLVKTLSRPAGSLPHEVSPFHHIVKEFLLINFVFIFVCFLIQLRSVQSRGVQVHRSLVHMAQNIDERIQSTEPFELRGAASALVVSISALVPESLDLSLIEIRNKTKYYFHTTPFGGRALVSSVPTGLYFLTFARNHSRDSVKTEDPSFEVTAVYGAKSWSNFFLASIAFSLPSFFTFGFDRVFEMKRKRRRCE